ACVDGGGGDGRGVVVGGGGVGENQVLDAVDRLQGDACGVAEDIVAVDPVVGDELGAPVDRVDADDSPVATPRVGVGHNQVLRAAVGSAAGAGGGGEERVGVWLIVGESAG